MPPRATPRRARAETPLARVLAHVVFWEWDAAADRIVASSTLPHIYGVASLEHISQGFTIVHPEDYEQHQTRVHHAVERGRGYKSSFRIVRPDTRRIVWIDERAEAVQRGASAPPVLVGVAIEAGVRHGAAAPRWFVDALDALEEFVDALLREHAATLRRSASRPMRAAPGRWLETAKREVARVKRLRVKNPRQTAAAIRRFTLQRSESKQPER